VRGEETPPPTVSSAGPQTKYRAITQRSDHLLRTHDDRQIRSQASMPATPATLPRVLGRHLMITKSRAAYRRFGEITIEE